MTRPCKHGVVGLRSGDKRNSCKCALCTEEIRVRDRARYHENQPKKLAYQSQRYAVYKNEILERNRLWRMRNAEMLSQAGKAWYQENKAFDLARRKEHYRNNQQQTRARRVAYYQANRKHEQLRNMQLAKERGLRTPSWWGELDEFVFTEAFDVSVRRRVTTGIKWHADHMLPVRGKVVSGLHTWNNVQVIPAALNRSKLNSFWLTEPLEWLQHI